MPYIILPLIRKARKAYCVALIVIVAVTDSSRQVIPTCVRLLATTRSCLVAHKEAVFALFV